MNAADLILDRRTTLQKIKRMATEIYEKNYIHGEVVLAGIPKGGMLLTEMLAESLRSFDGFGVHIISISFDKFARTQPPIEVDLRGYDFEGKAVVVIDDVLNSGRTLCYALQPLLAKPTKNIHTAVMVNRDHRRYPVIPDFVGYSLATTVDNHVTVVLDNHEQFGVYLTNKQ